MDPLSIFTEAVTGSLSTASISRVLGRTEPQPQTTASEPAASPPVNEDAVLVEISPEGAARAAANDPSLGTAAAQTDAAAANKSESTREKSETSVVDYAAQPVEDSSSEKKKGEQQEVQELKLRDREVRSHEQAHLSAAGQYARGGARFTYQSGPDGKQYAVGGEVSIDASPGATPEETLRKAQIVRRAALAPAEPSGTDRRVAAQASQMESRARAELAKERSESLEGEAEPSTENPKVDTDNKQVAEGPVTPKRSEATPVNESSEKQSMDPFGSLGSTTLKSLPGFQLESLPGQRFYAVA